MSLVSAVLAHLLFFYLAVLVPVLGRKSFAELKRQVYLDPRARVRFYRQNLFFGWVTVVLLAVILVPAADPWQAAGLRLSTGAYNLRFTAGMVLAAAFTFLMYRKPSPAYIRTYLAPVAPILPFTGLERRLWAAVSLKAGLVEELIYRGFVFYYLAVYVPGLPVPAVIAVSAVLFGLAHVYQGARVAVVSFLAGTVFGCVYYLTGTLWPVMAAHALTDLRVLRIWKPGAAGQ